MGKIMAVKTVLESIHEVKFEVDSRYTVLETIGNGAYGVVCSAYDNKSKTKVAIKKISRIFDIPTIAKRTLRELKILKYLNHHNIISIKDILRPPEDLSKFQDVYVVLDLMESDLHHIIYSKQVLSEDHVRYFLYQILCGLKYIHSANFLHRDLKPSNLLVNGNCELKIGDFGMARSLDSSPMEQRRVMTEYVQTRWYRAPELMLSVHQFNTGIDMWSVGCIFAEMLARRPLFPGSNYLNQLQLILSVVGLPSEEFISNATSERVKTYISKLPHKDPVPLKTLFPSASYKALNLLQSFLKLDPSQRCSAEEALASPFLHMYHNLDDEPTCTPLQFDFDAVPLERNALRASILNEILHIHASNKGVQLTPVASKLIAHVANGSCSNQNVASSSSQSSQSIISAQPVQSGETDKDALRKRKHAKLKKEAKCKKAKDQTKEDPKQGEKSDLSDQDRQMLERWKKMQETTKPFVHPIRKHMNELMQLKAQSVTLPEGTQSKDGQGTSGIDTVAGKPKVQFQFTNLVPMQKGGGVTLVKDTAKTEMQTKGKVTASLASGQKAVLVPVGSIPCYRIEGPYNQQGPLVIIQPSMAKPNVVQQQVVKSDAGVVSLAEKEDGPRAVPVAAVAPISSNRTEKLITTSQPQAVICKGDSTVSTKSKVSIAQSIPSLKLVPVCTKPTQPPVTKPTQPVLTKLTQSLVSKPTQSLVSKPTQPLVSKPTQPLVSKPTQPLVSKPTQPLVSKPTQPLVSKPTQPLVAKRVSPSDPKPTPPNVPVPNILAGVKGASTFSVTTDELRTSQNSNLQKSKDLLTVLPRTTEGSNPSKNHNLTIQQQSKPKLSVNICKRATIGSSEIKTLIRANVGARIVPPLVPRAENVTTSSIATVVISDNCTSSQSGVLLSSTKQSDGESGTIPVYTCDTRTSAKTNEAVTLDKEVHDQNESGHMKTILPPTCIPEKQFTPREKAILQLIEQFQSPKSDNFQCSNDGRGSTNGLGKENDDSDNADSSLHVNIRTEPTREMPALSLGMNDTEKMDSGLERSVNDILMTTLMTPRTPKSGACGYGLGFDLEEMLSQTGSPDFWNSSSRVLDTQTTNADEAMLPALSASLLNDWLDVRNMEPSDMEELQRELESTSSLLLFDS